MQTTLSSLLQSTERPPIEYPQIAGNYDLSKTFCLTIPYPLQSDLDFNRIDGILAMWGIYLSKVIVDFIATDIQGRLNPSYIENFLNQTLYSEVQSIIDSIEGTWCSATNTFICDDKDDEALYSVLEMAICGGYDQPLSIHSVIRDMVPLLYRYYNHIFIPEDHYLWEEWDYDLNMLNPDTALILFLEKENIDLLKSLM